MLGYVPFMVWFALLVYCILDIDRTPPGAARALPVHWWFVLVVAVPIAGAVAWLAWGRPAGRVAAVPASTASAPSARPGPTAASGPAEGTAPEADRSLRAELERIDREFEEAVRRSRKSAPRAGGAGVQPEQG
jgi:hypothetical protein